MTPAVLLVVFCAVMTAIALGNLATDPNRDPIDVGTTFVVAGITVFAFLWAAVTESWLRTTGRVAVAIAGGVVTVVAIAVIVRHWSESAASAREIDGDDA